MEKTRKKIQKKNIEDESQKLYIDDPKMSKDEYDRIVEMNVIGWSSAMECANDIWSSIHSSLLSGNLVFAFKSTKSGSEFGQIVVVQNLDRYNGNLLKDDFGIGMITTGFTMLLPHAPFKYLEEDIVEDLKKYKVDKEIIEVYKRIIEKFK